MNDEYVSLSEITDEIFKEYTSYPKGKDSFERTMRAKFDFLMNRVVMRSKLDLRFKGKDRIPKKDKSIVKALLIKSYFPDNDDDGDIFIKWFNSSIKETDYDSIILLGYRADYLISEEIYYEDWDLDKVTRDEWITAIESSINLSRALSIRKIEDELMRLYDASNVLNHDIPFGDIISTNKYGYRSYLWKNFRPDIDMNLPLNEILKGCCSQEDYTSLVLQLLLIMSQDARRKTNDFIKAYAELKKKYGCSFADELLGKDSLASEYIKFFQNIYEYLHDRPNLTKAIESEIGTEKLLEFFKMKDRNGKPPKKSKKK